MEKQTNQFESEPDGVVADKEKIELSKLVEKLNNYWISIKEKTDLCKEVFKSEDKDSILKALSIYFGLGLAADKEASIEHARSYYTENGRMVSPNSYERAVRALDDRDDISDSIALVKENELDKFVENYIREEIDNLLKIIKSTKYPGTALKETGAELEDKLSKIIKAFESDGMGVTLKNVFKVMKRHDIIGNYYYLKMLSQWGGLSGPYNMSNFVEEYLKMDMHEDAKKMLETLPYKNSDDDFDSRKEFLLEEIEEDKVKKDKVKTKKQKGVDGDGV